MAGRYSIQLASDGGTPRLSLNRNSYLTATRVVNKPGRLELHTAADFDRAFLQRDRQILVWRAPPGGVYRLFGIYFLRRWRRARERGKRITKLWGVCPNELLTRRVVTHYTGSAEADLTDYADDMMKTIVADSIADGSNPAPDAGTRVWGDFSVAGDLSAGPTLSKEIAFLPLLGASGGGVLSEIADAAENAGTPVYFEVAPTLPTPKTTAFQFRTYTGQPGSDLTTSMVFDEARGTLRDPYVDEDYSKEITYVYGGGKGEGDEREVEQVYDSSRYLASAWNRREAFVDATSQEGNGVREQARALLNDRRPVLKAGGQLADTTASRFGIDWWHGDKVRFRYEGQEFDALVRNTTITVRQGKETVTAKVESVS